MLKIDEVQIKGKEGVIFHLPMKYATKLNMPAKSILSIIERVSRIGEEIEISIKTEGCMKKEEAANAEVKK